MMNAKAFQGAMAEDRDRTLEKARHLIAQTTEALRIGASDGVFTREQQATLRETIEGYKGVLAGMDTVFAKYLTVVQQIGEQDAREDEARVAQARELYAHLDPRVGYEEFARLLVAYLYPHAQAEADSLASERSDDV
jgi:3-oxoacyl-ACP reductase-like protein